jgi:hypothetical protein
MGWSNDYAVYKGSTPPKDKKEDMWVWFNKSKVNNKISNIDLENFIRGGKEDKNLGEVLWRACIDEKPHFDSYQKSINEPSTRSFFSPWSQPTNTATNEDLFYVNHPRCAQIDGKLLGIIISKWSMATKCQIFNVDFDRAVIPVALEAVPAAPASVFPGKEKMDLHIYSTGTLVTRYVLREEKRDDDDDNDHGPSSRRLVHAKDEVPFIDQIDYRLVLGEKELMRWIAPGDYTYVEKADVEQHSPMYDMTFVGGFWSSYRVIKTKKYIDPALAMLVAHLCSTEFSIDAIMQDLDVKTPPSCPGVSGSFGNEGSGAFSISTGL